MKLVPAFALATVAAALLAACGGGGGSDEPAACAALASGSYWAIQPLNPEFSLDDDPLEFDAETGTLRFSENGAPAGLATLSADGGEACRFTLPVAGGGVEQLVVSASGIGASRFSSGGAVKGAFIFPASNVALSELAGDWNYVGSAVVDGRLFPLNGAFSVAADGAVTGLENFIGLDPLDPEPIMAASLGARDDGSFDETDNGVPTGTRFYATRAPNGVITLFAIDIGGGVPGVLIARRQSAVVASTIGAATNFWNLQYQTGGVTPILDFRVTVTGVNLGSTPRTETRVRSSDNRVDTRSYDFPRAGLLYRALNSCTNQTTGQPVGCGSTISLAEQGTGFTAAAGQGGADVNDFLDVSVIKP